MLNHHSASQELLNTESNSENLTLRTRDDISGSTEDDTSQWWGLNSALLGDAKSQTNTVIRLITVSMLNTHTHTFAQCWKEQRGAPVMSVLLRRRVAHMDHDSMSLSCCLWKHSEFIFWFLTFLQAYVINFKRNTHLKMCQLRMQDVSFGSHVTETGWLSFFFK